MQIPIMYYVCIKKVPKHTSNATKMSSINELTEIILKTLSQKEKYDYLAAFGAQKCMFCGNQRHLQKICKKRYLFLVRLF